MEPLMERLLELPLVPLRERGMLACVLLEHSMERELEPESVYHLV